MNERVEAPVVDLGKVPAPVVCACGKDIAQDAEGVWKHVANWQVECYNAAIYVGFVAAPQEV